MSFNKILIAIVIIISFFNFALITSATLITNENGIYFLYSTRNEKICSVCQGEKEHANTRYFNGESQQYLIKCLNCQGTGKEKRIVDFRKIVFPHGRAQYDAVSITEFKFPYIHFIYTGGTKRLHLKLLPKYQLNEIVDLIRTDSSGKLYLMHGKNMPKFDKNVMLATQINDFFKIKVKGEKRLKIHKDRNNKFYVERYGLVIVDKKYLYKINQRYYITNLFKDLKKLDKYSTFFLRVTKVNDLPKSAEKLSKNYYQLDFSFQVEAMLKPSRKQAFQVLRGAVKYHKFEVDEKTKPLNFLDFILAEGKKIADAEEAEKEKKRQKERELDKALS
ncbi:hypothetical protein AAEX28_11975 [Lentisphaerota bacterium WC36G]|nr:hypothetical protein LJT99_14810 [Lentisphaerae bacterium WC36]